MTLERVVPKQQFNLHQFNLHVSIVSSMKPFSGARLPTTTLRNSVGIFIQSSGLSAVESDVEAFAVMKEQKRVAIMMGLHRRLGDASPFRLLNPDVAKYVCDYI